ncbi:MAG: ABC transporter ATP-binding protein, partial [Chloroflexota bacterium]|nr:ABC transporter ATP-binding protein [Chloroflexota bacterium]
IITKKLSKKFDSFLAVDRVSLHVKAGEVLALLGPNGAGKTTTVRMLTSVLRPTEGSASVAGYDVVEDAPKVRASVGILTEQHGLYARMPTTEYLDFYGQLYNMPPVERRDRIEQLLNQLGLSNVRHQRIGTFSKGMRQKLALARALLHNPPVLLLDEPTSAMDPKSARLVRNAIKALRSAERAIVICTHNLFEAEELADRIAIIRRGKIIAKGSPTALKQTLLGPGEFEIRTAASLKENYNSIPAGITITSQGAKRIRYRTTHPNEDNPQMLRTLLKQDIPVISLQEVPRSLEQVYLEAVNAIDDREVLNVG